MRDAHYPQPATATPVPGRWRACLGTLLCLLLAACASSGARDAGPASRPYGLGEDPYHLPMDLATASNDVLMRAIGLVGTPYRYGGNSPEGGFDCSGLVDFVFRDAVGLSLPRSTRELIDLRAPDIGRDDLQPGDLVFFSPGGGQVSHIGIYVGEDRFVHAPSSGGTVRLDSLDSAYWKRSYRGAKRLLH